MKSSILNIVFVLTVTYLLTAEAQQQGCRCGDLGLGINPCTCSKTVVKAVGLEKPTYYASPQDINAAVAVRNNPIAYQLPVPSQTGCSNSQSVPSPINPTSVAYGSSISNTYVDSNAKTYSSESDSLAYSGSDSNAKSNGNLNTYSSDSSAYSGASVNGNSNSNVYGDSNSNSYSSSTVYSNTATSSSSSGSLPLPSGYTNGKPSGYINTGCGCNKRIVESSDSIETDDSINSNGNIAPRFPPIGDLCYPLPNSRSEQLIERTKVTPAYPGKIVCNSCNKMPYEICVNALTGETTSRKIVSKPFGATGGSSNPSPIIYGKSVSGTYPLIGIGRTGVVAGSASGLRSYENFNSESRFGAYGRSNFASFSPSTSGIHSLPSLLHANLNTANGGRQYAKAPTGNSFSNCDDDIDESQADYSYPEVPADAVSLTLAYKNLRAPNVIYRQGKQFVPEDKLSFGHRTLPNDVKSSKQIFDVPEEKLVTVEKPVVELKIAAPRTIVIGSYDEREEAKLAELEAIERESITQEETVDQVADGLLTYKDLGYAPVGSTYYRKSQNYDGIIQGEMNDSSEEPCGPLGPPVPDYIPGSVDVIENEGGDNVELSKITQFRQTNSPGYRSY